MNCQEVRELMQRHVDGDLNAAETATLMDHVEHCPDCAVMMERLVHLSRGLEQLPRVEPPYSLVDAILPKLGMADAISPDEAEETSVPSIAPRSRRAERSRRSWITRVSGVVALGIVVGLLLVNGPFSERMGNSEQDAAVAPKAANQEAELMNKMEAGSMEIQDQYGSEMPSAEKRQLSDSGPDVYSTSEDGSPDPSPSGNSGASSYEGGQGSEAAPMAAPSPAPAEEEPATESAAPQASDPGKSANIPDEAVSMPPADDEGGMNEGIMAFPEPTEPPLSIMGEPVPEEEAVSPDGKWRAVLIDGRLQIFRMSDGNLVYDQIPDAGVRSELVWSEDSTALNYTFTSADGVQTPMALIVDSSAFKEIAR